MFFTDKEYSLICKEDLVIIVWAKLTYFSYIDFTSINYSSIIQRAPGKAALKLPSPIEIKPDPSFINFWFIKADSTSCCSFSVTLVTNRYLPDGFIILPTILSKLHWGVSPVSGIFVGAFKQEVLSY